MNTLTPTRQLKRAFTLIEILIVVVILGILAAVVVPQFTNAADDANDAAVRSQLQTLRGQIELYRAQQGSDPDFITNGWSELMDNNYIMVEPTNSFNSSTTISASAASGVGWVWRDKSASNNTKALFAVNSDGSEFAD
jgi:type II secretion system protein G